MIDAAVKATRFMKPDDTDLILLEAASYQSCFRNYDQAKKLADQIQDEEDRSYAFYSIAISYARHGNPAQAVLLADSTTRKGEVLEHIAIWQAKQGDFAGALKTIDLIQDDLILRDNGVTKADWIRGYALLEVAILQAKAGNQNASLKMTDQAKILLKNYHDYVSVIGKLAEAYAYAGNLEEGSRWFKLLKENHKDSLPFMLTDVALGYATAKKYEMAFQLVKQHPDSSELGATIHSVGMLLLSRGDIERALELLSIPEEKWWQDDLLFELVKWSIKQQQPGKALKYVDQFDTNSTRLRIRSLLNIAELQHTLNQPLEAEKTSQQAHELIEAARNDHKLFAELQTDRAAYQLRHKNVKAAQSSLQAALKAARQINYTKSFSGDFYHPLQEIFQGQVQAGDIPGAKETLSFALEVLPQMKKAHGGFPVYVSNLKPDIVACYVEIGDLNTALKITTAEKNNDSFFTVIGETLGRKGDLAAAMKWCQQSVPDAMKARVLICIARGAIKSRGCDCDDPFQRIWDNAPWAI
ncbi:tetratricopeptide repeat protein [Gimesia panareensis]|uniref:tetratricopeptide repeat protein n=1 Tax=Gimesia panareensis TaxID=2527978 RepID=UPI0011A0BBF2|nr:tetratricopeptide repeat protein [Gimesia panareensis]